MATRYSTLAQVQVNTASTLLVRVKKRLAQAEKRISELDPLLISLTADERALRYITELGNRLES